MTHPVPMLEIWRGDVLESQHVGHAVVCNTAGEVVEAWGDPEKVILPRSSSKMLQALPLIESGAAAAYGLRSEHLALACASHQGAAIHRKAVAAWLDHIGLPDDAFRCGAQKPSDQDEYERLIRAHEGPCQYHNNCSGKHTGFLTLTKHLGAGPEYVDLDHPVQLQVRDVFEEMTGMKSPGYGIDGCSAPNFATELAAFATSLARMTHWDESVRGKATQQLVEAMMLHPDLVAGEGRACTKLMRAVAGKAAVKTGAEAVFAGILPQKGLGIAIKIDDGSTRASEAVMANLLVRYGVLDASDPVAQEYMVGPIRNWRGTVTGQMRLSSSLTN
ncbi:MAG: asparaginase [Litoreibacter sp.]